MEAQPPSLPARKNSGLAIASLVLGILSLACCSIITGLPAVVCGHIARAKIKRDPGLSGSGLALAGLILGYLSVVFLPISTALVVPAVVEAVARGQMVQDLSNQREIHIAISQMAAEKAPGYPADAGIKSVKELKTHLIKGGYLTEERAEELNFERFLFGNVSAADPEETVLVRSKLDLYPIERQVYMQKNGDGRMLRTESEWMSATGLEPQRNPTYLEEN